MSHSRRRFIATAGTAAGALVGLPRRAIAAQDAAQDVTGRGDFPGKPGLSILNDRPINIETPAHFLDEATTSTARMFVRNNGHPPVDVAPHQWQVQIGGESCIRPTTLTLADLKTRFSLHSYDLQIECGGNGRSEFRPRARGNQWTTGAIACPRWTGVRLKDVLAYCGVAKDAQYVAFVGADLHLSGDPNKTVISRGVPLHKAMEDESLLAFELNGEPIPLLHGAPLRLVCGGWPGSVSGKWLSQLLIRDRIHDGAKMLGTAYRIPCTPVAPGTKVEDADMCIIESMPVKSLITAPQSGARVSPGKPIIVQGHAWAGDLKVASVHTSIDFGATWQITETAQPINRLAWQHWQAQVKFERSGYHELWVRATDELGRSQPMLVPGWNPKGYLNNACHRVAVQVA